MPTRTTTDDLDIAEAVEARARFVAHNEALLVELTSLPKNHQVANASTGGAVTTVDALRRQLTDEPARFRAGLANALTADRAGLDRLKADRARLITEEAERRSQVAELGPNVASDDRVLIDQWARLRHMLVNLNADIGATETSIRRTRALLKGS